MNILLLALVLSMPSPIKLDLKIEKTKPQMPVFRPSGVREPYAILQEIWTFPEHIKREPKYIRIKLP
jgi:hypothetical protein